MSAATNTPVKGTTASIVTNSATDVLAAPGANKYNYITKIMVTNAHGSVGSYVKIVDETSGAILARGYAASGGGGWTYEGAPYIKQLVANKKVQAIVETNGADVTVNINGYVQA